MVGAMSTFADPGFATLLIHRSEVFTRLCEVSDASTDRNFAALLMNRLRVYTELCNISTWDGMWQLLNEYVWIGELHDRPGKGIFDSFYYLLT